jgi:microcystin-dependent protein
MPEPTTPNINLIVPNTGDLVGAWGTAALNPNFLGLDGLFGGVTNIPLSVATNITLTMATGTPTPSAGPYQSSNALIRFSGSLTGNAGIFFPRPGYYVVENTCTVGNFVVQLAPGNLTGRIVCAPPGQKIHVFYDGTHMDYANMPAVGTLADWCLATTPPWVNNCSVPPWLLCNGATYSTATFPQLFAYLGSTYGGNGVTTFGVPDFQNRYFIPMDFGSNNRITVATAGIDGTVFGATGGSQALQSHSHTSPALTDPGHQHPHSPPFLVNGGIGFLGGNPGVAWGTDSNTGTASTGITLAANVGTTGAGSSGNIPPAIVGGMRFIKT